MRPSLVRWVTTRVVRVAVALAVAWSIATAAAEVVAESARTAQAEIDATRPIASTTANDDGSGSVTVASAVP